MKRPEFDGPQNPTPKRAFQTNPKSVKHHADLISTSEFRYAWEQATLEYQRRALASASDNPTAVAYRLQGAEQFRDTFIEMSSIPSQMQSIDRDNLKT